MINPIDIVFQFKYEFKILKNLGFLGSPERKCNKKVKSCNKPTCLF